MTENKLRDYEKSMVTWCKSLQGKYKLMKKLNKKGMILGETTVVISVAILFFAALMDAGI